MTVLKQSSAMYVALKLVPEGGRMTVFTRDRQGARTGEVVVLEKELNNGGYGDWRVVSRPKTANPNLVPATRTEGTSEIIYSQDLARVLSDNDDLWADISDH